MNKRIKKLTIIILTLITLQNSIYAGNGGNVAAGVIGGLGVGALIGSAASRNRSRDVVYVQAPQQQPIRRNYSKEQQLRQWEHDLKMQDQDLQNFQHDLEDKELELQNLKRKLEKQKKDLDKRECSLKEREKKLTIKKNNQPQKELIG